MYILEWSKPSDFGFPILTVKTFNDTEYGKMIVLEKKLRKDKSILQISSKKV